MPIRILLPPEPLAPASRQQETIIIQSSGYRQLQRELLRYCQGEVEGRSFLIAGHRGAGKTTLVNDCVLQVGKLANGGSARPIIVRLHGPNLVRADGSPSRNGKEPGRDALSLSLSPTPPTGAAAKGSQPLDPEIVRAEYHREAEQKANEETPELRSVQLALKQITLSLHRAVMNEITTCYRDRVLEELDERKRAELFERAARLELELDQYPLPAELREFWRAGGFLQRGVLFGHEHRAPDQGFRELVALASVAQAYARVSGILKAELTQSSAATSERTAGTAKDTVDLIAPITSILTGGVAGTAVLAGANQGALAAALTGVLSAFGAAGVFKYSSTRSRKRTSSSGLTFLPDLRVATLDRALPVLIDRIRAAGLVPVFVVDELDKVPGLYNQLEDIVKHVKNIVAERAFFCFLTDRNYYERVVKVDVLDPYPKHYTYYTDRVFVSFQTSDLHRYLGAILHQEQDTPPPPPLPLPAEELSEPAPMPVPTIDDDEDRRDLEVLSYVVLRRSEMHAIELRRQLSVWRDRERPSWLDTTGVRSYMAYRFDLLVQFAVELILHREEVANRLRHDPALGRLLYDALYYPMRVLGKKGGGNGRRRRTPAAFELNLDDDVGRTHFEDYLIERMSSDREEELHQKKLREETGADVPTLGLDGVDVDFLYDQVRDLTHLLMDPFALMDELASEQNHMPQTSTTIIQALPLNPPAGPLLRQTGDHQYEWRYGPNWTYRQELVTTGKESSGSALSRQFALHVNLAIRLALASDEARQAIGLSDQRRRELHAMLRAIHQKWFEQAYEFYSGDLIPNGAAWAAPAIDVLGRLLSDHTEFSHRLSASSFRERYEPIRNTFVIRHAPLLALKGPRWLFQYDRDGNPRADGLEAAYWGDITGRWERNLDYINAITAALDHLRAVSPQTSEAPLDPGYLSATLQILRTTPSWRDVEPAVKRLTEFRKSRRFYNQFDEDANTIASYVAEVLLPGRQNLLNALFAGTIIGRAATSNLHDAAVKGLSVMSAAYWSRHDAEETADVTLERICSGLEHRWPALQSIRAQLRARLIMLENADEPAQFNAWTEAVSELCTGIDAAVRIGPHERVQLIAGAWKEWQAYFGQLYPKARFIPGIDGLLCQAAQAGPSVLLTNEPTSMSLVQWSEVYYRALAMESADDAEHAPRWLGVFARAALGLLPRKDVATTLSAETPGVYTANELRTIVENLSAEQVPPALKRILIVRLSSGSAVSSWSVPVGYGTIALTAQQIERLGQMRRSTRRNVQGIDDCDHIFVEQGGPEAELAIDNLARWFVGAVPPVTLFGETTQTPTWAARVIPKPSTAPDLVRTADAVALAGPDALPAPLCDLWNPGTGMIGQVETRGIDQLIMFNLRAAPKTPNEMVIRSRQGVQTAVLSFAGERLQRTDRFVRRHYRVTYDGVRVRLEQAAATFAPLDSLLPRGLHSALFSAFVAKQSVELTPGPTPTEWSIALRVAPPSALKLVGASAQERRESALLIVRSTRS